MKERLNTKLVEWWMIDTFKIERYELKEDNWYVLDLYWADWCYHTYYFESGKDLLKFIS